MFLNIKTGRLVIPINISSYSGSLVYGSIVIPTVLFAFIILPKHSAFLKASIGQSTFFTFVLFHCFELE
jgi:hypothetical protein